MTIAYFLEARGFDVNLVCSDLPGSSSKASGVIITVSFTPTPWPGLVNVLKALMSFVAPGNWLKGASEREWSQMASRCLQG
ncbi:MAG: hypothetical protein ACO2O0_08570 [Desulfurococcales archaeon]